MSEKSTRKAPNYAVESRVARNRSVFRPELQLCPCHTAEERYNLREQGRKRRFLLRMEWVGREETLRVANL